MVGVSCKVAAGESVRVGVFRDVWEREREALGVEEGLDAVWEGEGEAVGEIGADSVMEGDRVALGHALGEVE